MAKTRRRYRTYKRAARWSANLRNITSTTIQTTQLSLFQSNTTLCSNPPQSDDMVTTVYTVKNVEFNGNIEINDEVGYNAITGLVTYIMYVPQGMVVGPDYDVLHPEYILAMKYYGKPTNTSNIMPHSNPIRVKTRLARKLQSGDSIILLIKGANRASTPVSLNYSGITRWWTKSN